MIEQKGVVVLNQKEEYSRSVLPQMEVSIGGRIMNKLQAKNIVQAAKEKGVFEENEIETYGEKRKIIEEGNTEARKRQKLTKIEINKNLTRGDVSYSMGCSILSNVFQYCHK